RAVRWISCCSGVSVKSTTRLNQCQKAGSGWTAPKGACGLSPCAPTTTGQVSERGVWGENRRCSPNKNPPDVRRFRPPRRPAVSWLAPSTVARRGFDLLASRTRREPKCTCRKKASARAVDEERDALCEERVSPRYEPARIW